MSSVILTHLGESVPHYLPACVHQLRLWNPETPILLIVEPYHRATAEWQELCTSHNLQIVYTEDLPQTRHHAEFCSRYSGDTQFRKGYWKHVRERFFYIEELMIQRNLSHAVAMEYDILVYGNLTELCKTFQASHQTLRMVMDNPTRGHPGFLYIPTPAVMGEFCAFLAGIAEMPYEDMQALSLYSQLFEVHYLPVITEARNRTIAERRSAAGHTAIDPSFLSEDSELFGCLFDSLVAGQFLGGIDARNTGGHKCEGYENEGALYTFREMPFTWRRGEGGKWQPILDNRLLFTIHMHSKALTNFLSDRADMPTADYDVRAVYALLPPN